MRWLVRGLVPAGFYVLSLVMLPVPSAAQDGSTIVPTLRTATSRLGDFADRDSPSSSGWKAVLVGGNHLISSYNNAASDIGARLRHSGVNRVTVLHSPGPGAGGTPMARRRDIRQAWAALGEGEACLFFITSHATERGIYLSAETGFLGAGELSTIVTTECGERPTVLILSGCGTGAFIDSALARENHVILTASARGRVSYGATTMDRHVNFDRCVIQAIDGGARTWRHVFDLTLPCVRAREAELGVAASQPQAWFGSRVADLALPGR
ncbi:MAG TPA: hypothetical protein VJ890_13510 [Vineibacter sp.]|nr:hypothetical protein [Vineibacter sp.]